MRRDPVQGGLYGQGGLWGLPDPQAEARALWKLVQAGRSTPAQLLALVEVPAAIVVGLEAFAAENRRAGRSILRTLAFRQAVAVELRVLAARNVAPPIQGGTENLPGTRPGATEDEAAAPASDAPPEEEKMRYSHVASAFYNTPWYLTARKMSEIDSFLRPRLTGDVRFEISDAQLADWRAQREAAQARAAQNSRGGVAVIPIFGVISQRADMFTDASGGTPIERLAKSFRMALADPNIETIIFDVDSPGGSVLGVEELSKEIFQARGKKRVLAISNSLMASAAYYLASAADEVISTPSGDTGSIGVLSLHLDFSEQVKAAGIKPTFVTYGRHKAEGNELQPLGDETRDFWQQRVNEYGEMFVNAVARNRGVSPAAVRKDFGQGRSFGAKEAKQRGLVDRIASFDETLARLGVSRGPAMPAAVSSRALAARETGADPEAVLQQVAIDRDRLGDLPPRADRHAARDAFRHEPAAPTGDTAEALLESIAIDRERV